MPSRTSLLALLALSSALAGCPGDPAVGPAADAGWGGDIGGVVAPGDAQTTGLDDAASSAADTGTEARDGGAEAPDAGPEPADAASPSSPDASTAGPDDAGAGGPFGGACSPDFPGAPTGEWRHPVKSPGITLQGTPNHRVRDQVVSPGEATSLRVRFTYGVFDADMPDEDAEVWLRRCPGWELLGTVTTDSDGIAWAQMPTDLPKGEYAVRFMLLGDGTTAEGMLAVWPAGTQAVVTDLDGTMTTDDWQAWQDVLGLGSADMYPEANTAMDLWAAKGYRLLYLTARPQLVSRYSRQWLADQRFASGPLMLSEDGTPWNSTDAEKVAFKGGRLIEIASKGVFWRAAYGNATTDIEAYDDAAIPKADTYIIGPNAGVDDTQPLSDGYGDHLPTIGGYPDAVQP